MKIKRIDVLAVIFLAAVAAMIIGPIMIGLPRVSGELVRTNATTTVSETLVAKRCYTGDVNRRLFVEFHKPPTEYQPSPEFPEYILTLRDPDLPENNFLWWNVKHPTLDITRWNKSEHASLNCTIEENSIDIRFMIPLITPTYRGGASWPYLHSWNEGFRAQCISPDGERVSVDMTMKNCH